MAAWPASRKAEHHLFISHNLISSASVCGLTFNARPPSQWECYGPAGRPSRTAAGRGLWALRVAGAAGQSRAGWPASTSVSKPLSKEAGGEACSASLCREGREEGWTSRSRDEKAIFLLFLLKKVL